MALNVFWSSRRKKWVVVWTFCLTKRHVFVCFFPCMLCNSSCYDFSETNKVLSYEWVIISVSLKFFQNLELFIIWKNKTYPLEFTRVRDHQNHYFGAWITYFKELIPRARGFLWGDKWKWLDVPISVHKWVIEIVENTLPRKLL